ncbi:MAG: AI-2E family transporter [Candidatus Methanogaster sp.]|uniref:AI-2E family transporter n=1 Tax=Candidatus Methanogaster sp. TaxID=3386292 RepID=A0AC61KZT0_9EURY|nr:MAG: AI-2E family transporter [ANME-2 cluster archaeon]
MASDGVSELIEHKWTIATIAGISIIFLAIVYTVLPLVDGIVLGVVFAYVGRPINSKLLKYTRFAPFIATACIITPILFILGMGALEIINQITWVVDHHSEIMTSFIATIEGMDLPEFIYTGEDTSQMIENLTNSAIEILGQIPALEYAEKSLLLIINFIVSVFVCFFLLMDGDRFVALIRDLVPQPNNGIVDAFIEHADQTLSGLFIGNLYVAIFASVISVFVFYFFGVPHIPAMASLIFLASLIPIFAGWMILGPIAVGRYFEYGLWDAVIFYAIAATVIYGPTELVLRPYIVGVKSYTHPLLMLLMFLGGALVAGIAGFFIAPALMGLLIAAYRTYEDRIHGRIETPDIPQQ